MQVWKDGLKSQASPKKYNCFIIRAPDITC
jgi:hypothetical protein